ncbi:methyltransferase family protein [Sphingomonas sp. TDK1]|uniref:methyltransferase family protein n=1 Tax=Sphingomonas sp. TDK1 TaxID=453247 RepID=UPI0007D990BB|nr:isoprenylcysteine carboxylmethyltransferase family protein [Sphingomonas sp. TDK1]OAN64067.1 hypothetical protein A7X12_18300 [Sphingomonas sp. TDK1]
MIAIVDPAPVGAPGLVALLLGMLLFVAALVFVRWRKGAAREAVAHRSSSANQGIVLQATGFLLVAIGPLRPSLPAASAAAVGQAVVVALLIGTCVSLFISAAVAMGRNWSIGARTRRDHDLVTWGPFAVIRHPIYTGLLALLLALSVAFGHWRGLILGLPLFAWGTWIRIQAEESLLLAHFGRQYQAYAARVKRFLPGIF